MAVQSNTFGGLRLSGDDAAKFRRQVTHGRSSQAARSSAMSGIALAKQYLESGSAKVDNEDK